MTKEYSIYTISRLKDYASRPDGFIYQRKEDDNHLLYALSNAIKAFTSLTSALIDAFELSEPRYNTSLLDLRSL